MVWRLAESRGRQWVEEALEVFISAAEDGGEDIASVTVGGKSVAMLQRFDPGVLLECLQDALDTMDRQNGRYKPAPVVPKQTSVSLTPGGASSPLRL